MWHMWLLSHKEKLSIFLFLELIRMHKIDVDIIDYVMINEM